MSDLFKAGKSGDQSYKIISLVAENVKRLQAVEIKPNGNMVEITGRNGQGKTSILDAIFWAMKGRGVVQSTPIRKGCEEARIELNLGAIIVRRRFKVAKEGDGFTTDIRVEAADGFQARSPQALLDSLMGELSIDPLAFMRMEGKAQFDMLRGFVKGFDFDAHERGRAKLFAKRTDVNRDAKQARAAAQQMVVPSGLPDQMLDEAALTDELAKAGEHNASIETRRANRQIAAETIERLVAERLALSNSHPTKLAAIEQRRTAAVTDIERQIDALRARIISINAAADEEATTLHDEIGDETKRLESEAGALRRKLDEAPPLPDPIDASALTARIAEARNTNAGIRQRNLRDRQIENAVALEAEAKSLTDAIAAADKAKADAIAGADLPIPGIEFGDSALLLNGLPLDQASDAEQLRISVAIAMAMHPKLRVIRVRDGNVLDEDGMALLATLADEHDCQVFVETVRNDGRVAFVIEDGRVRQAVEAEAAE